MTLLLTPRYSSGEAVVQQLYDADAFTQGIKKRITRKELARVRVLRRKLKELRGEIPEEIKVEEYPVAVEALLARYSAEQRRLKELELSKRLLKELYSLLLHLETAQIEEQRMLEMLQQMEEEDLALFMMMV